jgi:hypothetical protein
MKMERREIARAWRQILDGSPRSRREMAASYKRKAELDLVQIDGGLGETAYEYQRKREAWTGMTPPDRKIPPVPTRAITRARTVWAAGVAALLLELLFAGFLASWLFAFPWYAAVPIAIVVAILLMVVIEGAASRVYREERPRESLRVFERLVGVTFGISFFALAPLVLVRTIPELAWAVGPALAILSLSQPALSAFFFLTARVAGWEEVLGRRFWKLRKEQAETKRFLDDLDRFGGDGDGEFPTGSTKPEQPLPLRHPGRMGGYDENARNAGSLSRNRPRIVGRSEPHGHAASPGTYRADPRLSGYERKS